MRHYHRETGVNEWHPSAMLLLSLACYSHPCAPDELLTSAGTCAPQAGQGGETDSPADDSSSSADDTHDSDASDDTGEAPEWTTLPATCEAPSDLPEDPLTLTGQEKKGQDNPQAGRFAEWVDLELDGDAAYAVGQGGLGLFDISDVTAPSFIDWFPAGDAFDRMHRVEVLDSDTLVVTNRENGMRITARDDEGDWQLISNVEGKGMEGIAWVDPWLYISVRGEGIRVYDLNDPENPSLETTVGGPNTTWDLSPVVDGWTYAADNAEGIYPIDLSSGGAPVVHDPIPMDGATLHIEATSDHLYVSNGGFGVRIYERSDPAVPTQIALVDTGGSATMTDTANDRLWVADHTGIAIFDISNPKKPTWLAREVSEQFALAIRVDGDQGWLGDWNFLSGFEYNGAVAGELSMSDEEIPFTNEAGTADAIITNRGNGVLDLVGATIDSDAFTIEASRSSLDPGQSARIRIDFSGSEEDLTATLCVASNDPDAPVQEVKVVSGRDPGSYVGGPATDFTLQDLDGNTYTLSEHLGAPVVLAYFATW